MEKRIDELTEISTLDADKDYLIVEDKSEESAESTKKVLASIVQSFSSGKGLSIETKSYADDTTLTAADMGKILKITVSVAGKTVTLPPQAEGLNVCIKNVGANSFTLSPASGEKIATATSKTVNAGVSIFILSNPGLSSDGWIIVG